MKTKRISHLVMLSLLWLALTWCAAALAATAPDASYAPRLEVSASVSVIAMQSDGRAVVAGDFTSVNGTSRYQLARLNADGSLDSSFVPSGFEVLTPMYFSLAVQADGKILVGGQLWWMTATGVARQNLARLNSDGSLDTSFDAGLYSVYGGGDAVLGIDGAVRSIVVQGDGKILIGGDFTRVRSGEKGVQRAYLARLNADGSADTSFNPGTGANALVRALALQSDGSVLVGGDFTAFNGASRGYVARLAANGALDNGFAPMVNGAVNSLALQSDGRIVIGGDFSMVGSQARERVARLQANGTLDAWATPLYFWSVKSVLALPDNSVVVGGWTPGIIFNGWPTDHDAHLVRYGSDGTPLGAQYFDGKPTEVLAMAQRPDGNLLVGGSFRNFARTQGMPVDYCHGLVLLNSFLSRASGFTAVAARSSAPSVLLDRGSGRVLVGGSFNLVNGANSPPLAQLNADGSVDSSFSAFALAGAVTAAVGLPDGSMAVAGSFRSADGSSPGSVIQLTANGTLTGKSSNVYAQALAATPDGKIYLGGSADAGFRGVLRLNAADWSIDSTFAVGTGLSNSVAPGRWVDYVNALAVQGDGRVLLAGQFDQFNGQARSNVVRLNIDGSVDSGFVPPLLTTSMSKSPEVFAITEQTDGKVLVGGYFQGYGASGASASGMLRLNANGSVDTGFTQSINNSGGEVRAIALQADGKMLVGGGFQIFEGALFFNYFVRLNQDGSRDATLAPSFTGSQVTRLLSGNGRILAAGDFYQVSGSPRAGLAAFQTGMALVAGWNLLGNGTDQALSVATLFGDASTPTALSAVTLSVWVWDARNSQWTFFSPTMTASELLSYAQSQRYQVLQSIAPRQGFWLHSKAPSSLPSPAGNPVTIAASDLVPGWNLVTDTRGLSATALHDSLGTAAANYTSLWAWDAPTARWWFHAPSLQAQGSAALADYIASQNFLDFTASGKTLQTGMGFWIFKPN
jgi:uncharacterized delta-60 repeat protein